MHSAAQAAEVQSLVARAYQCRPAGDREAAELVRSLEASLSEHGAGYAAPNLRAAVARLTAVDLSLARAKDRRAQLEGQLAQLQAQVLDPAARGHSATGAPASAVLIRRVAELELAAARAK